MIDLEKIKQSFARCILKGDVIERFYGLLLDSHPDIKPRFANTDFDSQKQLLRQGINLAIMFASDDPMGKNGIKRIRESHSKSGGLNVPPDLYPYWKKSFIQAISEFDPEFSDELRKQWDWVLQKTIDSIIEGYEG